MTKLNPRNEASRIALNTWLSTLADDPVRVEQVDDGGHVCTAVTLIAAEGTSLSLVGEVLVSPATRELVFTDLEPTSRGRGILEEHGIDPADHWWAANTLAWRFAEEIAKVFLPRLPAPAPAG